MHLPVFYFLVLCLGLSPVSLVQAMELQPKQEPLVLTRGSTNLSAYIGYLVDEHNNLTITNVRSRDEDYWRQNQRDILDLGFQKQPVWLRLKLNFGEINEQEAWRLHLGTGLFRDLEVYVFSDDVAVQPPYLVKNLQKFSDKPSFHPDYIVPLKAQSNSELDVFIRIQHPTQILLPITLETNTSLRVSTQNFQFLMGAFVGLILFISLYNFFVFISTKDIAYLYYVIYVSASGIYFVALNGIGFQYLWPEFPGFTSGGIPCRLVR